MVLSAKDTSVSGIQFPHFWKWTFCNTYLKESEERKYDFIRNPLFFSFFWIFEDSKTFLFQKFKNVSKSQRSKIWVHWIILVETSTQTSISKKGWSYQHLCKRKWQNERNIRRKVPCLATTKSCSFNSDTDLWKWITIRNMAWSNCVLIHLVVKPIGPYNIRGPSWRGNPWSTSFLILLSQERHPNYRIN